MIENSSKVTEGWIGPGRRDEVIERLQQLSPVAEAHQNRPGPAERL